MGVALLIFFVGLYYFVISVLFLLDAADSHDKVFKTKKVFYRTFFPIILLYDLFIKIIKTYKELK